MMEATGTTPQITSMRSSTSPTPSSRSVWPSMLGFTKEQIATGLLVPVIGNTYAGAAIIGLTAILDIAEPGDRILMVSFGSGAGSDAFALTVTDAIRERRDLRPAHPGLHRPPHGDRLRHLRPLPRQAGDEIDGRQL